MLWVDLVIDNGFLDHFVVVPDFLLTCNSTRLEAVVYDIDEGRVFVQQVLQLPFHIIQVAAQRFRIFQSS